MALPSRKNREREAARAKLKTDQQVANNAAALAERQGEREVEVAEKIQRAKPLTDTYLDGPRVDGAERYFANVDRLLLLLRQEQMKHAETKQERDRAILDRHEAMYLSQRAKLANTVGAATIFASGIKTKLAKLHREIERVYEMKIDTITFDDETGLIRPNETK